MSSQATATIRTGSPPIPSTSPPKTFRPHRNLFARLAFIQMEAGKGKKPSPVRC
jgi:hypothetical protein